MLADAIVRDTVFELEEEGIFLADEDDEYDSIFELASESEEYNGDNASSKKQKKRDFLGTWGF